MCLMTEFMGSLKGSQNKYPQNEENE